MSHPVSEDSYSVALDPDLRLRQRVAATHSQLPTRDRRQYAMPEISIQKQCAGLTDLVLAESFGEPIGDLPKQTDSGFFEAGNLVAGT